MMSCQSFTTASRSPVKAVRRLMPALFTRIEMLPALARHLGSIGTAGLAIRHVEREAVGLAARVEDLLGGLPRGVGVHIEHDDARTLACVADRDRAPDAGTCAGDGRDVVFQTAPPYVPPLSWIRPEDSKRAACLARLGRKGTNAMCRNIKTLFNFDPPATEEEIRASALQFVRKLSGFNRPSQANAAAFDRAVDEVSAAARKLLCLAADPCARPRPGGRGREGAGARPGAVRLKSPDCASCHQAYHWRVQQLAMTNPGRMADGETGGVCARA